MRDVDHSRDFEEATGGHGQRSLSSGEHHKQSDQCNRTEEQRPIHDIEAKEISGAAFVLIVKHARSQMLLLSAEFDGPR